MTWMAFLTPGRAKCRSFVSFQAFVAFLHISQIYIPLAMDFNHVEPKFRKIAWTVQMFLILILILSAMRSVSKMVLSNAPPVDASAVSWNEGLGKWAICAPKGSDLIAVGAGMSKSASQKPRDESTIRTSAPVAKRETIYDPPKKTDAMDCAIFDLTKWKIPEKPYHFFLCGEVHRQNIDETKYFVWSNNQWSYVEHTGPHRYAFFKLVRTKEGFDYGYGKDMYNSETLFQVNTAESKQASRWCGSMTEFGKTTGKASAIEISIEDDVILEYITLGTIPQLLNILSSLGGSLSIMTLIFFQIFPKKNKGSAISQEYEARTLRFAKGAKKEDESTAPPEGNQEFRASRRPSKAPLPPQVP